MPPSRETGDAAIDVLSDVLRAIRLTAALFFPLKASSPWADEVPAAPALVASILPAAQHVVSYHIVSEGACWIALPDAEAVRLSAGDIIVIPHGDKYVMSSERGLRSELPPDAVLTFFRAMSTGAAPPIVVEGGGGPDHADLVCGFLGCDRRPFNPVLEALPRLVHLRRSHDASGRDRLTPLIELAMQLASRMLLEGTAKVSTVGFDVGYQSEAAFSRAFKDTVGVSPAAWRRMRSTTPIQAGR
jgi:AraC-like DNA-binding protein